MKHYLSVGLSILISLAGLAQGAVTSFKGAENSYVKSLSTSSPDQYFESLNITKEDLINIIGSPYEAVIFQPGNIYSNDKLVVSNIPLRYNIFSDEIEINSSNANREDLSVLLKSPTIFAKIGPDVFVYVENLSNYDQSGYFKVVQEGEHFDLYKKSKVNYVDKQFARNSYQQDQPARFDRTDIYYLIDKRGLFYELPSNRRRFATVFKEHNKEIESYVRKNRLDINNENDLGKIVKHFNEIL